MRHLILLFCLACMSCTGHSRLVPKNKKGAAEPYSSEMNLSCTSYLLDLRDRSIPPVLTKAPAYRFQVLLNGKMHHVECLSLYDCPSSEGGEETCVDTRKCCDLGLAH